MEVLVHHGALERLGDRLRDAVGEATIWCWDPETGITRPDGTSPSPGEQPAPAAAWFSVENFLDGSNHAFARAAVHLGSLRWVQTTSAGLDQGYYEPLAAAGIAISNCHVQAVGIAELVLAEVLAARTGLDARRAREADHTWHQRDRREVFATTWLLVGFGAIGRAVARRARPFGATVVGLRRSGRPDELADRMVDPGSLREELSGADVVVLACPLTAETRGLADAEFFAAMKPGSILVNVARGGVLVEDDLPAALADGRPGTAVLDVFATEPLPADHLFWDHPQIRVSSHVAGMSEGFVGRADEACLANLARFAAGKEPTDIVDPAVLFGA